MGAKRPGSAVFLIDVDDTLLDNDRFEADVRQFLEQEIGSAAGKRYWEFFEELREKLSYVDYLGALQLLRLSQPHMPGIPSVSSFLLEYPFADRLYPGALDVLGTLRRQGTLVLLTDGDAVFQPHKIRVSGLGDAVDQNILIYVHKEKELDDVARRYPAERYVLIDDKPKILAAVKNIWKDRVATVLPKQGHYARNPKVSTAYPKADIEIDRIGDLLTQTIPA